MTSLPDSETLGVCYLLGVLTGITLFAVIRYIIDIAND